MYRNSAYFVVNASKNSLIVISLKSSKLSTFLIINNVEMIQFFRVGNLPTFSNDCVDWPSKQLCNAGEKRLNCFAIAFLINSFVFLVTCQLVFDFKKIDNFLD